MTEVKMITVWTPLERQLFLLNEATPVIDSWQVNRTLPRYCFYKNGATSRFLAFRYNVNDALGMKDAFYQMSDEDFQSLVDVFKSDHVRSLLDVWMIQRGFT